MLSEHMMIGSQLPSATVTCYLQLAKFYTGAAVSRYMLAGVIL